MESEFGDHFVEKQLGITPEEKEEIWRWDGEHSPRGPGTGVHVVVAATVGRDRWKRN